MKRMIIFALLIILLVTCTKEISNNKSKATAVNDIVTAEDTVKIPLNDLRRRTFMGDTGGLYPGGRNIPTGTYASDLLVASNRIVPLDTFGLPAENGKIVFISLGGSTGGHNMMELKAKTVNNPLTNPKLLLLNCNNGYRSGSLNSIMNPKDPYWDHVSKILHDYKSSYRSVQVMYLETDDSTRYVEWPGRPDTVKKELIKCMNVFKKKFPKIKILYVLGRTRTFGNQRPWNREPSPYYFGWACKWAIEDQINGVPATRYKGANAVAPMITWGFYQWADSIPRKTDGFSWRSSQTSDGLHATPEAQDTLATRFQTFLLTDKYASIWYAAH